MKRLGRNMEGHENYLTSDIDRIVRVCAEAGYLIDRTTAATAYGEYSEDVWAAGWMSMPDNDDEILRAILQYTVVEGE